MCTCGYGLHLPARCLDLNHSHFGGTAPLHPAKSRWWRWSRWYCAHGTWRAPSRVVHSHSSRAVQTHNLLLPFNEKGATGAPNVGGSVSTMLHVRIIPPPIRAKKKCRGGTPKTVGRDSCSIPLQCCLCRVHHASPSICYTRTYTLSTPLHGTSFRGMGRKHDPTYPNRRCRNLTC